MSVEKFTAQWRRLAVCNKLELNLSRVELRTVVNICYTPWSATRCRNYVADFVCLRRRSLHLCNWVRHTFINLPTPNIDYTQSVCDSLHSRVSTVIRRQDDSWKWVIKNKTEQKWLCRGTCHCCCAAGRLHGRRHTLHWSHWYCDVIAVGRWTQTLSASHVCWRKLSSSPGQVKVFHISRPTPLPKDADKLYCVLRSFVHLPRVFDGLIFMTSIDNPLYAYHEHDYTVILALQRLLFLWFVY